MKGIVFTEFMEMVEDKFSPDIADHIIEVSDLPSGGIYTVLGTYDYSEMLQLVTTLSQVTHLNVPDLVRTFGQHLFDRFVSIYPQFFDGPNTTFEFLENLEDYIHVEVYKLYPEAQLPNFDYECVSPHKLVMVYRSACPFADLAEGLLKGCIEHFKENIELQRDNLTGGQTGTAARFVLIRQ